MCCNNIRRLVIGRMLDRRKSVDIFTDGKHDNAARMLTGGAPDPLNTFGDPGHFCPSLTDALILIVAEHITGSSFIRNGANGTGTIGLSLAENDFRIGMGF